MSETSTSRKTSPIRKIIAAPFVLLMVLMVLAFPGVSIFMAYRTAAMLVTWKRAAGWVETPATIEHLELDVNSDSDGTTYRVVCRYSYTFNDKHYQNDRVGLTGGSDNIGSWQQDTYNRLKSHQDSIESDPLFCWVNPADPQEAVLDRSLRIGMVLFQMVFVIMFGGGSVAVVLFGRARKQKKQGESVRRLEHPDEPWLWKPAWADGRIGSRQRIWPLWVFAIFWNVVSLPGVALLVPEAVGSGEYWALVFLLFPIIGVGLLAAATVATLRQSRFGRSHFDLQTLPGVIGGHLTGDLVIVGDVASLEEVSVALRCVNRITRRKGDSDETTELPLWEDTQTLRVAPATYGQTELRITVDFRIPYDCLPYDDANPKDQTLWQLTAKADIAGANLDLKFEVPVFRTKTSDATIGEPPEKAARAEAILESADSPLPWKIRREVDLGGKTVFIVSAWPGWSTFIMTTVLAAGLLIGGGLWLRRMWQNDGWSILMPAALCLAGLASLRAVVGGALGSTRISVSLAEVVIERWPRFLRRRVAIPAIDIQEIKISDSAQVRSGSEMTQYHVVHLVTTHGRKVKLGGMIPSKSAAQWLVRQIDDGLTRPPS